MKKIGLNLLIICLYCFPFVYFFMYKDFHSGSMIGYLLMIILTAVIAYFGKSTNNKFSLIIGNIASVMTSYYFINNMAGYESWEGYFKPLTPVQLLIFVSILNLIPQLIAVKAANKFKKNHDGKLII